MGNNKSTKAAQAKRSLSIRLGNQTSFAARLLEPFEFAVASGFTAFELFPDRGFSGKSGWDERELDAAIRQQIRGTAAERDIALTVHAPLEFDPLRDPEDGRLHSTVQLAVDIGAKMVNLHLDASQGVEKFLDALSPALWACAEAGVHLVLENTVYTSPEDFNQFFALLCAGPKHPVTHVGMCLDIGHANLCSTTLNDYLGFVDRLSAEVPIRHLHLHENYGDRDSHLTLFTGPSAVNPSGLTGLLARLADRNFAGCAIFEQWPFPASLLSAARDKLLKMISSATPALNSGSARIP